MYRLAARGRQSQASQTFKVIQPLLL